MAQFSEIPVFVAGEPGFAAKLNQLGRVLGEVIEALDTPTPASTPAPVARKAPSRKTAIS